MLDGVHSPTLAQWEGAGRTARFSPVGKVTGSAAPGEDGFLSPDQKPLLMTFGSCSCRFALAGFQQLVRRAARKQVRYRNPSPVCLSCTPKEQVLVVLPSQPNLTIPYTGLSLFTRVITRVALNLHIPCVRTYAQPGRHHLPT